MNFLVCSYFFLNFILFSTFFSLFSLKFCTSVKILKKQAQTRVFSHFSRNFAKNTIFSRFFTNFHEISRFFLKFRIFYRLFSIFTQSYPSIFHVFYDFLLNFHFFSILPFLFLFQTRLHFFRKNLNFNDFLQFFESKFDVLL